MKINIFSIRLNGVRGLSVKHTAGKTRPASGQSSVFLNKDSACEHTAHEGNLPEKLTSLQGACKILQLMPWC